MYAREIDIFVGYTEIFKSLLYVRRIYIDQTAAQDVGNVVGKGEICITEF